MNSVLNWEIPIRTCIWKEQNLLAYLHDFDGWNSEFQNACGHFDGIPRKGQRRTNGHVKLNQFNHMDVVDLYTDAHSIMRNRDGIKRDESEHIFFLVQMSGSYNMDHNGFRITTRVGDCVLLDSTKTVEFYFPEGGSRLLSLHLPRQVFLSACEGSVEIGQLLRRDHPMAAAIRQQLVKFGLNSQTPDTKGKASNDMFLSMIQLAFTKQSGMSDILQWDSNAHRYELLLQYIDSNLGSEKLSLDWLANKMNLSPRQIQRIFGKEDSSFVKVVRHKRLNLVADYLRSFGKVEKTRISEIAFGAGFSDLSNFNRSFKSHFGKTPSEYIESNIAKYRPDQCVTRDKLDNSGVLNQFPI